MADNAELATDGGPPSPVKTRSANRAKTQTPEHRWLKLMAGCIGPLLDILVLIFLMAVFTTGHKFQCGNDAAFRAVVPGRRNHARQRNLCPARHLLGPRCAYAEVCAPPAIELAAEY